jgi:hypothetical protein
MARRTEMALNLRWSGVMQFFGKGMAYRGWRVPALRTQTAWFALALTPTDFGNKTCPKNPMAPEFLR